MKKLSKPPEEPPGASSDSSRQPSDETIAKDGRFGQPLPMTPVRDLVKASLSGRQAPSMGTVGSRSQVSRGTRKGHPIVGRLLLHKRVVSRPGDPITVSGIYEVIHEAHIENGDKTSQELICIKGGQFPSCARCALGVRFRLVQAYQHIGDSEYFRKAHGMLRLRP